MNDSVYWLGQDNNVYQRSGDKVSNRGTLLKDYGIAFDAKLASGVGRRIADPNVGRGNTNNDYLKQLQDQLKSLSSQVAYRPRLPRFDVAANLNKARTTAQSNVNPLYEKYLSEYLAKSQNLKQNKLRETELKREATALELSQALEGSAVNRQRTIEDTATGIQRLGEQEGQFQQDSGTQFDRERMANAESIAASGLTTSGLGQNKMFEQAKDRNISEERQVAEFNNQREAKKLFESRTIGDLIRGDDQARATTTQKDKEAQFDLDAYLSELSQDETQFRTSNEIKRVSDVNQQTETFRRQGSQEFLASLAGAGWKPQDIALAYQVYG